MYVCTPSLRPSSRYVYLSVHLSVCLFVRSARLYVQLICLSFHPSTRRSIQSICLSIPLIGRSVCLFGHSDLSNSLSINPSSVLLSLPCLSIPCFHLSVRPSSPSICPSSRWVCLLVYPFLSIFASVCPPIRLSIQSIFPSIPLIGRIPLPVQSVRQFILFFHPFQLSSPSFCPSSMSLLLCVLPVCQSVRPALRLQLISTDAVLVTHVNARKF